MLLTAEARVSGRYGLDLFVRIEGRDAEADATALWWRLVDDAGAPVASAWLNEGFEDGAVVPADQPVFGLPEFGTSFTVPGFFRTPGAVARLELALVDDRGHRSDTRVLDFLPQAERGFGDPCDPSYIDDRCATGLGCRGEPATCVEGEAPGIDRFAYLLSDDMTRILIEGSDPDDDVLAVRIEFLNEQDEPAEIDFDGDGVVDGDSFDAFPTEIGQGEFFIGVYPAEGFDTLVTRLAATPVDSAGRMGERQVVALRGILERDWNQGCDARGFDVCTELATCIPGLVGAINRCGAPNRAREDECNSAPVLVAPGDNLRFFGQARGASLWDPPEGCTHNFAAQRPEAVVHLELTRGLPFLRLSTDLPATDFDTVLYVMRGECPAPGADTEYLGCHDDVAGGLTSTLELTNVPAGDYLVVVDAWRSEGGSFQLVVETE